MRVLSARTAWRLFLVAIAVLVSLAYIGDRSANRYADSEAWVSHTRQVEAQIATLRADIAMASASRYQIPSDSTAVDRYKAAAQDVSVQIVALQRLTGDNPVQQENIRKLRPLLDHRMALIAASIAAGSPARPGPAAAGEEASAIAAVTDMLQSMRDEEETLLANRTLVSAESYRNLRLALAGGLLATALVLAFAFRTLLVQLSMRASAEQAVRSLSAHILRVQDTERRRLGRELHDGVGQLFTAMLMELDVVGRMGNLSADQGKHLQSSRDLAERGLAETRTISYLLHPPLLDELGFQHAAKWYVEGFSNRSKIDVSVRFSEPFKRLPDALELVLFRVIQESLTNVHRHSGSKRAEIVVTQYPDRVAATVRDFGKGIDPALLKKIERSSTGPGVGLGGMRERVSDLGGHFAIESGSSGTTVTVSLPLPAEQESFVNGNPNASAASVKSAPRERDGGVGGLTMAALN
jgi:signal transduction histidine kinase